MTCKHVLLDINLRPIKGPAFCLVCAQTSGETLAQDMAGGPSLPDDTRCWECGGEVEIEAGNNAYCLACLRKP